MWGNKRAQDEIALNLKCPNWEGTHYFNPKFELLYTSWGHTLWKTCKDDQLSTRTVIQCKEWGTSLTRKDFSQK